MNRKACYKCAHHHVCHTAKAEFFHDITNCFYKRFNPTRRSPKFNLVIIVNNPDEYMPEENQVEPGFRELHMTKSSPCNFCNHCGFTCWGDGSIHKCTGFEPFPKEYLEAHESFMEDFLNDCPF